MSKSVALPAEKMPNMAVKGTRRPKAVLKVGLLIGFGGFVSRP
jgi:hypothetical protein